MKNIKKKLAVILCLCIIGEKIPIPYVIAQEKGIGNISNYQDNIPATPSDNIQTNDSEDEDGFWPDDEELFDDRGLLPDATPSNATPSNATPSNMEAGLDRILAVADYSEPLFENETYYIESEEHLQWIRERVNLGADDMKGKHLMLLEDIELQNEWIPIGIDSSHPFKGSFDGNQKTISNVFIHTLSDKNAGFFGYVETDQECSISDLTLDSVDICLENMEIAGALIADLHGNGSSKVQINNCEINGKIYVSGRSQNRIEGGMIGVLDLNNDSNISIKKCMARVNIESIGNEGIGSNATAGGLIGKLELSEAAKVQIRRCQSEGEVIARSNMQSTAGGLIGKTTASGAGTFIMISQSGFKGDVNVQTTWSGYCDANAGGIIGMNEVSLEMKECFHQGSVFCRSYYARTGGAIGKVNFDQTYTLMIENILIDSDITAQCTNGSSVCGGVLGATSGGKLDGAVIENAYVTGTMDASAKAAIINWYSGNKETTVRNSYFSYEALGINKDHVSCELGAFTTTWFRDSVENSYGLTSAEQQDPDSYIGWDLKRIWNVEEGSPKLRFLDYWMVPGYEESIYPKEIHDEYCNLVIEFSDVVEMDLGSIELYNYNTDELIERIYTSDCEVKDSSTLVIPSYKLPFDEKIYVLADEGSIILGGKPFEGLKEKDDWVFYTKPDGARLILKIIDESGTPVLSAKVYAQHQLFEPDSQGIANIYIQGLSQENLNDFLLVSAPGYVTRSKKIGDLGLDTYGNAFGIVTLYHDKDPSSPVIRYVSLFDEGDPYGCDIGQVIREYTTLPGELSTIYAYVDWRGNTPGKVYMEQLYKTDDQTIKKQLNLEENSHISVSIGEYFEKTTIKDEKNHTEKEVPIYLVAESADGKKSPQYFTNLKVVEGIAFSDSGDFGLSLGQNFSLKVPDSLPIIGGRDIGFKYPGVPFIMDVKQKGNKLTVLIAPAKTDQDDNQDEDEWDKSLLEIIQDSVKWSEFKDAVNKFETRRGIAETFCGSIFGMLSDGFGWKTETKAIGYIEAVADTNRSWTVVEGKFAGNMDVSYNATSYLCMLGPVPVYGSVSGGVQGTLEMGMKDTPFTSMRDLDTFRNFQIKPHASLGPGAGIPGFLNAELNGSAEIPIDMGTNQIITEKPLPGHELSKLFDNIKVSLTASLKAKATALIFSFEKKIWGHTWTLYNNSPEKAAVISDPASYRLMSRQYAAKATSWNSSKKNLVKTNVYPNASPKLMPYRDGQILMWLDDARERSSVNRTQLMYSVCSRDGRWSEARAVCDDGTADFDFDLLVNDGKVFVVWQNIKSVLPEDVTLTEMAKELEISAAIMEPSAGQFADQQSLSGSTGIKAMPMLMNDGQDVQAVWTECSSDNYLLMDGINYLKTSTYSDGGWKQEKTVFETEHTIVQMETDKTSQVPRAAFIIDMDRSQVNGEGYELFLLQQGGVARLTSNDIMDANPCFLEFEGQAALFTCRGDGIACRRETSWNIENMMTGSDDPKVASRFQVYPCGNDLLVMYIADSGKGDGQELQALIYDTDSGKWGKPVSITECESSIYDFAGFQDNNGQYHIVNMQMNGDTEIADMEVQNILPYTDIEILGEPMYLQSDVKPESDIPIMAKISNKGLKKVTSVTMDVEGETEIFTTENNINLLPGEETVIEGNFMFEEGIIRQDLRVRLQVPDDVNPYNNESSIEIGLPDISVEKVELLRDGDDYMVLAYIRNATAERIDDVSVNLKLLTSDGTSISDKKTMDLTDQGMKVVSLPMKKSVLQQTQRKVVPLYVTVEADIEEALDSNNRYWITVDNPYVTSEEPGESERLDLDWLYYEMKPGEIFTLHTRTYPDISSGSGITWKSSMPEIAEVSSDGVVTAKSPGKTNIIVSAFEGKVTKICEINVVEEESGDPVNQTVKLNVKQILLTQTEQRYDLLYSIMPETDEKQSIVWKSSNKAVATVTQDGTVTALGNGIAQITVILMNGKSDTCMVTVKLEDEDTDKPEDPDKKPSGEEPEKPSKPNHGSSYSSSGGKSSGGKGKFGGNGKWMKDENGWWYQYEDGTFPAKTWAFLLYQNQYEWYYFDERGYMLSGWLLMDGVWYYLNPLSDGMKGKMLTGWQLIDGKWYYFSERSDGTKGAMLTDTWVGEYYVNRDGVWEEGKTF